MMRYRPAEAICHRAERAFCIARPNLSLARIRPEKGTSRNIVADSSTEDRQFHGPQPVNRRTRFFNPGRIETSADNGAPTRLPARTENSDGALGLDALLERQRQAPLPVLYGEKPGVTPPRPA